MLHQALTTLIGSCARCPNAATTERCQLTTAVEMSVMKWGSRGQKVESRSRITALNLREGRVARLLRQHLLVGARAAGERPHRHAARPRPPRDVDDGQPHLHCAAHPGRRRHLRCAHARPLCSGSPHAPPSLLSHAALPSPLAGTLGGSWDQGVIEDITAWLMDASKCPTTWAPLLSIRQQHGAQWRSAA